MKGIMAEKKVKKTVPLKKKTVKKLTKTNRTVASSKRQSPVVKKQVKKISKMEERISLAKPIQKTSMIKNSKKSSKNLIVLLIILLLATLAYFLKDEIIVAQVDGKPITRFALIKNLEKQGASQVLSSMTTEALLRQAIKDSGVVVAEEEVNQEMQNLEDTLTAQGQKLDDLLEAQGVSRQEIADQIRLSKQMEKILADKVTVTDEEVQSYYDDNITAFKGSSFDEVKDQLREQLRQQKLSTAQQEWLADLQKKANVVYYKFAPKPTDGLY